MISHHFPPAFHRLLHGISTTILVALSVTVTISSTVTSELLYVVSGKEIKSTDTDSHFLTGTSKCPILPCGKWVSAFPR